MREIRFRVWNGGKYITLGDAMFEYEIVDVVGVKFDTITPKMAVEQYTGLKDKNGKEIYEGDILTPIAYAGLTKDKRFKCEVIFKNGMFCFAVRKPFITKSDPLYTSIGRGKRAGNDYIINGNIHENPELLSTDKI